MDHTLAPRERFMEVCGMDDAKLFYQMHYPLSPFSEAMRTLRSGIDISDVDQPPNIIQVTSGRPSEDKTTIAVTPQSQPRPEG
jgi:succinoglycan biosynthesis transport protein ExoP